MFLLIPATAFIVILVATGLVLAKFNGWLENRRWEKARQWHYDREKRYGSRLEKARQWHYDREKRYGNVQR